MKPRREIHRGETNGENGRANEIPRSRFSSDLPPPSLALSLSLFDLFLLFWRLLLFHPVDRTRPRQRRAFPVGEARPTLRRRIFKREENSLSVSSARPLSPSRRGREGEARGWQCGLFAEKSHSVGRAAAARITLFARRRAGAGGCCEGRGEGEIGYGGAEQKAPSTHAPNFGKHLADSRRSFSPPPPSPPRS